MARILTFLFTILLMICVAAAFGQALTNNNALITISPNSRVTVLGGVLNNGDLINDGTLSVSGDWMNADTYTPGDGLFIFDGTGTQNIAHNGGQVFQMQITGGGEKVISGGLQVQDTLELLDGIITISGQANLLVQPNGTVVGGSDQSYVAGPLYHQGTGYKYYPLGSNGNFRPAELLNVTGTDPVVGISVHQPNPNPIIPLQLLSISDVRYWQLVHQSGVYDGAQIRVKVGDDERLDIEADPADLVVAASDSISGMFLSIGQSNFSGSLLDGELTSASAAVASYYAIAVEGFAEERALFVPNALSPAAPDPEDQVIKVYGQQIVDEDFVFSIYNRWGQLVYETRSFTEANTIGWSGNTAGGDPESMGVYQYTLSGKFTSGRTFKRHGSISVIR